MKESIETKINNRTKQRYIDFILSQYDKNDKSKHKQNLKYLESISEEQYQQDFVMLEKIK